MSSPLPVDSAPTGGVGSGTTAPLTAKQQAGGDIPKVSPVSEAFSSPVGSR